MYQPRSGIRELKLTTLVENSRSSNTLHPLPSSGLSWGAICSKEKVWRAYISIATFWPERIHCWISQSDRPGTYQSELLFSVINNENNHGPWYRVVWKLLLWSSKTGPILLWNDLCFQSKQYWMLGQTIGTPRASTDLIFSASTLIGTFWQYPRRCEQNTAQPIL